MRWLNYFLLIVTAVCVQTQIVCAQSSLTLPPLILDSPPETLPRTPAEELVNVQKNMDDLQLQLLAAQGEKKPDEDLKKRVELLQKQIEVQQNMIKLLLDHVKKEPLAGSPVEKVQTQVTGLEARSKQAAQRDQELGQAVDNLTEHMDATERNGPRLPATLKELFLPSRTNETPLSIYGTLVGGYQLFPSQRGQGHFFFDAIEPIFLLQLNDHILLEAELEFGTSGVGVGYAQMDYIVNDWLTLVGGRFLGPVGFFNERLHPDWINKMPDFPLMMRQVSLADFSLNGIQARGAAYLFGSPLKLEYSLYLANGLGVPGEGILTDLADLGALKDTTTEVNDAMAFGGRTGLWWPEIGLNGGFSLFYNRRYGEDASNNIRLWGIDLNYHQGNWDFRLEYAHMFQNTNGFLDDNIQRRGLYAQIAFRPYNAPAQVVQNLEFVFRFSYARFTGIDPTALDLTAFETPVDAPVDRDQYTFGINYFLAPSAVIKFAYEINR